MGGRDTIRIPTNCTLDIGLLTFFLGRPLEGVQEVPQAQVKENLNGIDRELRKQREKTLNLRLKVLPYSTKSPT